MTKMEQVFKREPKQNDAVKLLLYFTINSSSKIMILPHLAPWLYFAYIFDKLALCFYLDTS